MVIYFHSTVITKVMLLYNTEWWYDLGMVVNYHGEKFYNIGPRGHFMIKLAPFLVLILPNILNNVSPPSCSKYVSFKI